MDKLNSAASVPTRIVGEIVISLKDKLSSLKQSRCLSIWNKINTGTEDSKLEINDALWTTVKNSFDEKLCASLIKFLSSFICQTGTFELTKSFFLFNLAAASDQRKFFLNESLLEYRFCVTRPELRDIEQLVSRLDSLISGGTSVNSDNLNPTRIDSSSGNQKKATNMTSWLHSDYSIFDSQPQTAKVKRETEINEMSKEKILDQFKMKRSSISEKNILAALKSPPMNEIKKSVTNLAGSQAQLMNTGGKLQISPTVGIQALVTGKKKDKKKEKSRKSGTGIGINTFDDRGKKSIHIQGKDTDRETAKPSKKHKSRDGSMKFLTDRTQNVFGEKFSMIVSNALNTQAHSHRRPVNQLPLKREKSTSKERRKDY